MAKKTWIGVAAAAGAMLALFAAPAQARTDVHLNIGLGTGYYSQPSYVYSQPSYVYSQPSYIYSQPSYVYSQPYGYAYGYNQPRQMRDRDGDGVPNRFDRRPNNPRRY
jgi:hypothetical protein